VTDGIPFLRSGPYPAREGNAVQLLIDGLAAFRRICEAVEAAERSVWVTVTFMWPSFEMPDGRGTALDVLDRAAGRGIDVRIIFWRPDDDTGPHTRNTFGGSAHQIALLEARRSEGKIRWDRAATGFCQHQKSWLVDAGLESETAFVGGINLNPHSVVLPGHGGERENHDAYLELRGPSAVDVHHNFVERWNEASERLAHHGAWGAGSETDLPLPVGVPRSCGNAIAQIQRTTAAGERSNLRQYCGAIDAARRSIYIEQQYLESSEILECLQGALRRGVEVVAVVPVKPDRASTVAARATLGQYENFTLAGIAALGVDGERLAIYVHAKLMLVDDEWATVGSCNLHRYSLFGNSEMNVAFRDPSAVRSMRVALFLEHLAEDTSGMDDRSALRLFRKIALENRARADAGIHAWRGLAFSLDVDSYGRA
jgi:cardiolipin synthase A/B